MRLVVVIGYHADSRTSKPFPVYAGRDSAEAEAAMEASNALVFEVIRNPTTVRKRRKTPLPFIEPQPEAPVVDEAAAEARIMALRVELAELEAAALFAAESAAAAAATTPVVEDTAAPAPPVEPQPSGGVSGKRGRAA